MNSNVAAQGGSGRTKEKILACHKKLQNDPGWVFRRWLLRREQGCSCQGQAITIYHLTLPHCQVLLNQGLTHQHNLPAALNRAGLSGFGRENAAKAKANMARNQHDR